MAAGLLLLVVAGLLVTLSAAAWQHLPERGRPLRVLVIAVVVALACAKFLGW